MSKADCAYEAVEGITPEQARRSEGELIGYQGIKCHLNFDVKMNFTRKARFVAGRHTTETPASLTYSSVVSRESVRIAVFLGALNGLDVMSCGIGNAYLNAKCREKIWFKSGPECGESAGEVCKLSHKTGSGEAYYEYLLVYLSMLTILVFSEKPGEVWTIAKHFTLKDGYAEPDTFLGAGLSKKFYKDKS